MTDQELDNVDAVLIEASWLRAIRNTIKRPRPNPCPPDFDRLRDLENILFLAIEAAEPYPSETP